MPDFKKAPTVNGDTIFSTEIATAAQQTVLNTTDKFAIDDSGVLKYVEWDTILTTLTSGSYVDLSTNQSVGGEKTWEDRAIFESPVVLAGTTALASAPLTVYDNGSAQMAFFVNEVAASYTDASPNASIRFRSRYTSGIAVDTAQIKWGLAAAYTSSGARFGIDILNLNGNFINALTIDGQGRVAIGHGAPDVLLHVSGAGVPAKITSSNNSYQLMLTYTAGSSTGYIGTLNNGILFAPSSATTAMAITSGGVVGIGTTDPVSYDAYGKLVVVGNNSVATGSSVRNLHNSGSAYQAVGNNSVSVNIFARGSAKPSNFGSMLGAIDIYSNGASAFVISSFDAAPLIFGTSNTQRIRIEGNGKIVVNTTITDSFAQLFVEGNIRTRPAFYVDETGGNYTRYLGIVQYATGAVTNWSGYPGVTEIYSYNAGGMVIGTLGTNPGSVSFGTAGVVRGGFFATGGFYSSITSSTSQPLDLYQGGTGPMIYFSGGYSGAAPGAYWGKIKVMVGGGVGLCYIPLYG